MQKAGRFPSRHSPARTAPPTPRAPSCWCWGRRTCATQTCRASESQLHVSPFRAQRGPSSSDFCSSKGSEHVFLRFSAFLLRMFLNRDYERREFSPLHEWLTLAALATRHAHRRNRREKGGEKFFCQVPPLLATVPRNPDGPRQIHRCPYFLLSKTRRSWG